MTSATHSALPDSQIETAKDNVLSNQRLDTKSKRLQSLDQFRGYTVFGMLIVNYFGGYQACPQVLKHTHDYCSYADTIMPQFLFAVGFSLRLTVGRQLQSGQTLESYLRVVRRLLGLVLVALVVYAVSPRANSWEELTKLGFWGAIQEPLKRQWFQTLMHIAVTSLWLVPVIHRSSTTRIGWLIGSASLHVILSYLFNFTWCNTSPKAIDGGPLGFLTWTIPAMLGTFACDWFVAGNGAAEAADEHRGRPVAWSLWIAIALMAVGYLLSCGTRFYDVRPADKSEALPKLALDPVLPASSRIEQINSSKNNWMDWCAEAPFVKPPESSERQWNYWMMSQRAGTLSYLTFAAGFSLAVFVLFYFLCDVAKLQLPLFTTFGTNALAAYVLHDLVSNAVQPFFPKDSPYWYAYLGLVLFCWINWLFLRSLQRQKIFLRV